MINTWKSYLCININIDEKKKVRAGSPDFLFLILLHKC